MTEQLREQTLLVFKGARAFLAHSKGSHNLYHCTHFHVHPLLLLSILVFTYITHRAHVYTKLKPTGTLEVKMDYGTTRRRGWLSQSTCFFCFVQVTTLPNLDSEITVLSISHFEVYKQQNVRSQGPKPNKNFFSHCTSKIFKGSVTIALNNGINQCERHCNDRSSYLN